MKYSFTILLLIYLGIVMTRFAPSSPAAIPTPIAGIVPHHLLVADIIQNFFINLSHNRFDNIVVVGPNHAELGPTTIAKNPDFDDQTITSLKPYIDTTFPQAHLTTYLLKHSVSLTECAGLAKEIRSLGGETLVIASIDFSHYLSVEQARRNDRLTLSKIKSREYASILTMNSDYLDSPGALVTLLQYLDLQGETTMDILSYDNSGLRANPYAPTTSYYSIIFYDKK